MFNFSKQTKSFVALLLIAFTAVMTAYYLSGLLNNNDEQFSQETANKQTPKKEVQQTIVDNATDTNKKIDTTNWREFKDSRFDVSFRYPPTWTLKTYKEEKDDGMLIIRLDPGNGANTISVYISEDNYYAMEGLPTKKTTVAGHQALSVADMLVGVRYDTKYYTFDLGGNVKYQPEFKVILDQVAFQK
mgnify:CR=1 FL=1